MPTAGRHLVHPAFNTCLQAVVHMGFAAVHMVNWQAVRAWRSRLGICICAFMPGPSRLECTAAVDQYYGLHAAIHTTSTGSFLRPIEASRRLCSFRRLWETLEAKLERNPASAWH